VGFQNNADHGKFHVMAATVTQTNLLRMHTYLSYVLRLGIMTENLKSDPGLWRTFEYIHMYQSAPASRRRVDLADFWCTLPN
jgi:hypothetical protein